MKKLLLVLLLISALLSFITRDLPEVISASADLNDDEKIIVIDAGHGGEDGGTSGKTGVLEKDINLQISLLLEELFKDAGYNVIMTRDGDYSIGDAELDTVSKRKASDIKKRVEICNSSGADCVISIHQNYFEEDKYSGAQVFYGSNDGSKALAEAVQLRLREDVQPENTREVKPGGESIYLLKNTTIPAIIVECGFLSNPSEEKCLTDPTYQQKLAYSIFLGTDSCINH